jgi:hypothetical protein
MMLRTIKNLTPLPVRIFLKERLPKQLVSAVATAPGTSHKSGNAGHRVGAVNTKHKLIKSQCPICGTALACPSGQPEVRCTGCGSSPNQRLLTLAFYAYSDADKSILVLGSDSILQSLCDSSKDALWASDLAHVPSGCRTHIDLCIHSPGLRATAMSLEKLLKDTDALLSPQGKQVLTLEGFSASWRLVRWQFKAARFVRWLQQKGWSEVSEFAPDDYYGAGSSDIFSCRATGNLTDAVLVLPKISIKYMGQ